jgi:hypothetical protein
MSSSAEFLLLVQSRLGDREGGYLQNRASSVMDLVARLVEPGLTVCLVREFEALTARRIHDYTRAGESAPPMIACVAASRGTAAGAGKGRSVPRAGIDAFACPGARPENNTGKSHLIANLSLRKPYLTVFSRSLSTLARTVIQQQRWHHITAASAACDGRAVPARGGCSRLRAAPPVSVGRSAHSGTGATDAQSA